MNNQQRLTGIIPGDDCDITFMSDKFSFTFVPNRIVEGGEDFTLPIQNGFLYGATHDNKNVAIFLGYNYEGMSHYCGFNTGIPMYLISDRPNPKNDIRTFKSIVFQGGILNSLSRNRAAKVDHKDGNIIIQPKYVQQRYSFQTNDGVCTVEIAQATSQSWSASTDKTTINRIVSLALDFEEPQDLSSLRKHYHNIVLLISIMTRRQENHFDDIYITPVNQDALPFPEFTHVNIVDNDVPVIDNLREYVLFEELGEGVARLLELFYTSKEKKTSYSLGFIAKNDNEKRYITEDKIRSICSALECEESFHTEIELSQTQPLEELCEKVRKAISEFRQSSPNANMISSGTYAVIKTSLDHWTMSAYEKAIRLLKRFEKPIHAYLGERQTMIQESEVHDLIGFRNSISHGAYREIDDRIMRAADVMEVLVYCSLFQRIGVPEETIIDICKHRF